MKDYIVTRTFVHRGATWHRGGVVKLSETEAHEPFVRAHVMEADAGGLADGLSERSPAINAGYFGNGREKPREEAPSRAASGETGDMTVAQLRDALGKMGVPCPPNARRGELAALYENAKEAVAGSQERSAAGAAQGGELGI